MKRKLIFILFAVLALSCKKEPIVDSGTDSETDSGIVQEPEEPGNNDEPEEPGNNDDPIDVVVDSLPETVTMVLNFWNAADTWAFNEEPVADSLQTSVGESYTYNITWEFDGKQMTKNFDFVLSQGDNGAAYYHRVLNGFIYKMFCLSAADNAWIKLPAVPGRHLRAVSISHFNTGRKCFRIQETSASDAADAGMTYSSAMSESDGWTPVETSVEFPIAAASEMGNLLEPALGQSYYMMFTSGSSLRLAELRIVYTKSLESDFEMPTSDIECPEVPTTISNSEKFGNISNYGDETDNKGWN